MVKNSSRSRSRGPRRSRSRGRMEDGYQSDEATVRPFRKVKKKNAGKQKSPKKLMYKEGEEVMARWPGSKLYYQATIQHVRHDLGEYDVIYENGVVFTLAPKEVFKQPVSNKRQSRTKSVETDEKDETDFTEDEDITTMLVKAAVNISKKVSNKSFKEPVSKTSNGSRVASRASKTDLFSDDDDELLSVSQRPSASSLILSKSKRLSSSSKLGQTSRSSRMDRVSFSSTINNLLENVFQRKQESIVEEENSKDDIANGENTEVIESDDQKETNDKDNETTVSEKSESKISMSSKISNKSKPSKKSSNTSLGLDEFSEDEFEDDKVTTATVGASVATSSGHNLEWIISIFFMILCPSLLIFLHNLCTAHGTNLKPPSISLNPLDYFDKEAMMIVLSFLAVLRFCEFVCIGKYVEGHRINGFQTLLICLLFVPGLLLHEISLHFVLEKYFYIMTSCIFISFILSLISFIMSYKYSEDQLNIKGNTGNPVNDFYHGRVVNPVLMGWNLKLQTFRFSMIGLALLNVSLVTQSVLENSGQVNMGLLVSSSMQVLYAMDAMFHEEYYFNSADYLHSGYGWSVISSYITFPFLPSLLTRYMIYFPPTSHPLPLIIAGVINMLGYIIYRSAETQRCEFAKNPKNPELAKVEAFEGPQGKKLIVSGLWSIVRHPNYLGEILIQWSWVIPIAWTLGLKFLVPYYLPVVTTVMLMLKCAQTNNRNKRKFGNVWQDYSRKVKANLIPFVY